MKAAVCSAGVWDLRAFSPACQLACSLAPPSPVRMLQLLDQLVAQALEQMPLLLRVVDNIALLDLLVSFFHVVAGARQCTASAAIRMRLPAPAAECATAACKHVCAVCPHPPQSPHPCGCGRAFACSRPQFQSPPPPPAGSPFEYSRPQFQSDGPLAIIQGRHPVVESMDSVVYQVPVPLDCQSMDSVAYLVQPLHTACCHALLSRALG